MGSLIEINDTLKISKERGFPKDLCLEQHVQNPTDAARFLGRVFPFWNKDERLYIKSPTRVLLVEELNGKWLFWGNAVIVEQTITEGKTSGRYCISKIYMPDFQREITIEESPPGKSYFAARPRSILQ